MSNFTKHYTLDGKKYQADFIDMGNRYEVNFDGWTFSDEESFNLFLKQNNFEEVPEVKLPEVGKRYKSKRINYGDVKIMIVDKELDSYVFKNKHGYGCHSDLDRFHDYFEELPNQEEIKETKADSKTISHQVYIKNDPNPLNYTASYTVPINGKLESKLHFGERVEKAKEEVKYHLRIKHYFDYKAAVEDLKKATQNLLEALEETKDLDSRKERFDKVKGAKIVLYPSLSPTHKEKIPESDMADALFYGVDCALKEKPKSIWKDVSELPETTSHIIAKDCLGRYSVFESNNKMILNLKDGGIVNQDIISKFCLLSDYINDQEQFKQHVLEILNKEGNNGKL
jgi:hypothetical protein